MATTELEAVRLSSFIEYDESWTQTDCHWLRQKFFDCTWTVSRGNIYDSENTLIKLGASPSAVSFYYRMGPAVSVPTNGKISDYYTQISLTNLTSNSKLTLDYDLSASTGKSLFRNLDTYTYTMCLTSLSDQELVDLYREQCITIYSAAVYTDNESKQVRISYAKTLPYLDIKLPPYLISNAEVKKFSSKKFLCSWDEAIPQREDSPVDGYRVELLMRQTGTEEFVKVKGLYLDQDDEGNYWIRKDHTFIENTYSEVPTDTEELNDFLAETSTFVNQAASSEIELSDAKITQVYFNPKDFCVKRTDSFKFIVYPYTIQSEHDAYDENGNLIQEENELGELYTVRVPSALLAGTGTESEGEDGRTNVIRVKYNNTWTEGLIWVKVNGEWKEATSVYTKAGGSWKEPV